MVWSLPVGIGAAMFIQTTRAAVVGASTRLGTPLPADHAEVSMIALRLLPALIVPVLLWFGFVNHTAAEHPRRRTLMQISVVAVLIIAGIAVSGALV